MNTKKEVFGQMTFCTRKDAEKYIRQYLTFGIYKLKHGESRRPDYRALKVRNTGLYGIYVKYFYHYGTPPKDGWLLNYNNL